MCCPITLMLYGDPVIASDACMYEKSAIKVPHTSTTARSMSTRLSVGPLTLP